jgi:Raf kinase inhibitor-like YbhB/YbcL family protein
MLRKITSALILTSSLFGLELKSPVFDNGGTIPITYTCDGKNISPPLFWKDIPKNTKSLVLIMHDPDAPIGDFTHWLVYKILPTLKGLPEGVLNKPVVEHGINQGINDFGFVGYGGPCPPPWDKAHRYIFELYALDYVPNIPPSANRNAVEKALKGHVIEKASLIGKYKRNKPFMFSRF